MGRIEGTGKGGAGINELKVNEEGEALVFSVSEQEIEHVSEREGLSFNWSSDIFSASANDTILMVRNTSKTHDLHIEHIGLACGVTASEHTIHVIKDSTTLAGDGATITGFNLNTGKSAVAEAEAVVDETANSSQGTVIGTEWIATDTDLDIDVRGLILTTNAAVGVDRVETGTESAVTITGFYKLKTA